MNRNAFEAQTSRPDLQKLGGCVLRARRGDESGRAQVLSALTWVAFSCPEATEKVYDAVAATWHGKQEEVAELPLFEEASLGPSFWAAYWQVIDGAAQGYDAASITAAVASLGAVLGPSFGEIAEQHARKHPGADRPHLKVTPGITDIDGLKHLPDDSLGKSLYDLLTINGFDAEVLDRDTIMLAQLPPALRYLNTRILQMHDVWHLVAGYTTDAVHEVAISAFQLAQFGHNYSAMFLAIAAHITHERSPRGFTILMQIMADAWRHGRETPPLMAIEWESMMPLTIDQVRKTHEITPFQSRVPSELVETFSGGSFWQKLKMGLTVMLLNQEIRQA